MRAASSDSRLPAAGHDVQHLECGHDAVAAGGVLGHDHVAALLAADAGTRDQHRLEDVLVARPACGRRGHRPASTICSRPPFESTLSTTVLAASAAALEPVEGDDAEQLVAIDDLAVLVDGHAAVRVAVEREAEVAAVPGHDRGDAPPVTPRRSRR